LAAQIASQWQGYGLNPEIRGINRANELAQILANYGITDLSKIGVKETPYEEMVNAVTGEGGQDSWSTVTRNRGQLTYGDQTFGRLGGFGSGGEREFSAPQEYLQQSDPGRYGLGYSAAGKGWTEFEVVKDASGKAVIVPRWGSSSDLDPGLIQILGLIAAPLTGGLSTALAGTFGAAAPIVAQGLVSGTLGGFGAEAQGGSFGSGFGKGALTGGITAGIGQFAQPFANSIGADVLASTGSQALSDAATAAVRAGAGALPSAIVSGNFGNVLTSALTAGATSGITAGLSDLTGFTQPQISAAVNIAQGAASGDLQKILAGASAFTDSQIPGLASKALTLKTAVESGDPTRIMSAMQGFGSAMDAYNNQQARDNSKTDTGDETARLQARYGTSTDAATAAAYADPSRSLDTVLGGDIRGATMQTTAGVDLDGLGLTEPTITAGELANIVSGKTDTTAAPAAQTTTTTTATAPTTVDTSGLPAFNKATITTLPQSRAAEIIAEMYPGQSLDWVNQGVLNAAASHIRADDETGLRARLASGQALGTGDAISGDVAIDYKAPAGTRVAQPGENAGILGYTEKGTPVNLIQQLGTTARKMTPEEAFAFDMANAGESIDPLTGLPYELDTSENAMAIADVIRGPVSSVAGGIGEQAKLLGVAGGWLTGDRDNALKQWGSNVESWANSITPDSVKKGQDAISKQISEADGLPAKAWAAVTGAATNPLATLHWIGKEGIQQVLPLGSAVAVGRTVSAATKLKYGEELSKRAGLGSAITTDASMNAGESATASYEEVYNTLRDKGVPVDKASSAASAAAAGSGLVTLFTAAIGDAALVKQLMNNIKGATINATLKEGPTEFAEGALQSVVEDNATNLALGKGLVFDPNKALTSGTIEALIGTGTTATISKGADIFTPTVADTQTTTAPATTPATTPTTTAPTTQGRTEPTFDPNTVVATDPDTGDALTLGDITGGNTLSTAGDTTRIDPTLEALDGTEIDSSQIINDYINEVLGSQAASIATADSTTIVGIDENGNAVTLADLGLGTAPATPATTATTATPAASVTTGSTADVVLGTDPDTGAAVTMGDIGLAGALTTSPATTTARTTGTDAKTGDQVGVKTPTATTTPTSPSPTASSATAPSTTTAPIAAPAIGGVEAQIQNLSGATQTQLNNLSATQQQQFNDLTASQKEQADALVQQGVSLQTAITQSQQASQQFTQQQIQNLSAQTVQQLGQMTASQQAQFNQLTAQQQAEADARVQQGQSLQEAINASQQQTQAQLQQLSSTTQQQLGQLNQQQQAQFNQLSIQQQAEADARVQQGLSLQQAIQVAQQQNQAQLQMLSTQTQQQFTTLGEQQKQQFNTLTDAQKQQADAFVQLGLGLQTAIDAARQASTDQYNALVESQRKERIAQQKQAELANLTASTQAIMQGAQQQQPSASGSAQELMRTEEADLEAMTMVRKAELEEKRKGAREKLKSRKA
jgi:hypothetical protein